MKAAVASFATIDSTSAEAARRAAAGERGPLWIVADEQLGGRGRSGRAWASPPGNLYATCLFDPACDAAQAARHSFAAALAVAELAGHFGAPAAVKWPNDVLVSGRKVAGLLLQASGGGRVAWLSVGFGVNLRHHPADARWMATDLTAETGATPDRDEALEVLAARFGHWADVLSREGFAPLRAAWLDRAARLGQMIEARVGDAVHRGIFEGIDGTGALILGEGHGKRLITAADVHFPVDEVSHAARD